MLSYQQNYFNPCVELTRELWERVTSDPSLQENVHKCTEIYEQLGKGDRHAHLLKMAGRLRYIVDNSAAKLKALVRLAPYVQEWEAKEHNTKEIDDICDTAVQQKFYMSKPKVVQDVLARAGVRPTKNEEEKKDNYLFQLQRFFATQLNDNLPEPYKTCMISLDPLNVTPCIYAAGTMFCTLMTRLHYMHYTGEDQRMNPQAVVIGPPASGKGFAEKLNEIIMAPMKQADQLARDTEKKYKKDSRAFEDGGVKMKGQARYHFRFCDKLLMQFVYAGLSFDRLIIDPKYKSTNRTADADNVEVHIYVQDDPKDNRLQIKYHR